jgi:uncharacterized protein
MKKYQTLALAFALFGVVLFYNSRLIIDNSSDTYLAPSATFNIFEKQVRTIFNNDLGLNLSFNLPATENDKKKFLMNLHAFVKDVENMKKIHKVHSIFSAEYVEGREGEILTEKIANSEDYDFKLILKNIEKSPAGDDILISRDKTKLGIYIEPNIGSVSLDTLAQNKTIENLLEKHSLSKYRGERAGYFRLEVAQFNALISDTSIFVPLTFVVGLLLLYSQFPSLLLTFFAMLIMGLSVNFATGLYGLFQWPFNLISSMIPSLISALSVAFILHVFNSIRHSVLISGDISQGIREGARAVRRPSFYSAFTTSIGLFSLTTSDIPPVATFGIAGGLGVLGIFLFSNYLLPSLLQMTELKHWQKKTHFGKMIDRIIYWSLHVSVRHHKLVIATTVVMTIFALMQIPKIKTETDFIKFFKSDHPVSIETEVLDKSFVGSNPLDIVFMSEEQENLESYDFFNFLKNLDSFVSTLPEVDKSLSAYNFISQIHRAFNFPEKDVSLPTEDAAYAQYLIMFDGDDLQDFYNSDELKSRMNLFLNIHGARETEDIVKTIDIYVKENIPKNVTYQYAGFGNALLEQDKILVNGQINSLMTSIVIITLIMMILWKSPTAGLLSMIPNVSPIIFIFGTMGLFNIWLDMGTAMIASISVGIAVDDTIHIFHEFRQNMLKGYSPLMALGRTYKKSGRAVVGTSLILSFQFFIFIFSMFIPTTYFGLLSAIGLLVALLFDIFFLPSFLFVATHNKRFFYYMTGVKYE